MSAVLGLFLIVFVIGTAMNNAHITYIAARLPLQGRLTDPSSPWPLPRIWANHPGILTMDPANFATTSNLKGCDVIEEAVSRYRKIMFANSEIKPSQETNVTNLSKLTVHVTKTECGGYPNEDSNESYKLSIKANGASITSHSVWGALRGLETFSQLLYTKDNRYYLNEADIEDWPRFGYRGLLVDTARHFIRATVLLDILDAMAYNKMNVFHWHIVDDQSFPYVSKAFPSLSEKASFSPHHIYTQADISRIIQFARLRGIRVVPEFDTPGHTQSWGKAFPDLLTPCWVEGEPYRAKYGLNGHATSENFDPTKNKTYEFMKTFLGEIVQVFKDEYIDLGMDEAHYYCWQSSPNISAFMTLNGFAPGEYHKLERYYGSRLISIVQSLGAKIYIYQDPIEHGALFDRNIVVRIWKGESLWQPFAYNVTRLGHRVIVSSCYYLNFIHYGQDWKDFYNCDPQEFGGSKKQRQRVLGGEASLWAEYVDNTNILSRMWPRASAVAERLWSSAEVNDTVSATFRLDEQRCRMLRRGIPAEPILPGYCGSWDLDDPTEPKPTTVPDCPTGSAGRPSLAASITAILIDALLMLNVVFLGSNFN